MTNHLRTIFSGNSIELVIDYTKESGSEWEEFHGPHQIEMGSVTINGVDLCIDGASVNILPVLSEDQLSYLVKHYTR